MSKQAKKVETYPPVVHKQSRLAGMITTEELAKLLEITPLTAKRIRRGCDLKLSHALAISRRFGVAVEDIWLRRQKA